MKKLLGVSVFVIIFTLFCEMDIIPMRASAVEKKTVRVGCPMQPGLTEKSSNGTYRGYTVDYLWELSKYTDWEYEFVEVEGDLNTQQSTLLEMLQSGEIDMLGAMNYSDELEKTYLYPSFNYGTAYTSLAIPKDSQKWMESDYANWNGIRVATYPGLDRRMELLEKFAEVNGFVYITERRDTYEECLKAIEDGKADAILQVDISMEEGYRSIAKFNPTPYYLALNKERTDLLRDLNQGLYDLNQSYPALQADLSNKYFSDKGNFYLSQENKDYIKSLEPVRVLFFAGNSPIQDFYKNEPLGVAASFFERFCKDTGLAYTPVFADSYEEGLRMILDGEVDLVSAVPVEADLTSKGRLKLSRTFFRSYSICVSAEKSKDNLSDVQLLSANVHEKLSSMRRSKEGKCFLDAYCVNFYTRRQELYDNLVFDWGNSSPIRYSVGLVENTEDERLLQILNSYISSMTDEVTQEMLYENSNGKVRYTMAEFLITYKWALLFGAVLVVGLFHIYLMRRNNIQLRQRALENERFYQFSMLTNECLFEYDFNQDRMNVQNSQIFFPGAKKIDAFGKTVELSKDGSEKYMQGILHEMLMKREEQRDVEFQLNDMDCWYRVQIKYIGENGEYAIGRISDVNQDVIDRRNLERRATTDMLTQLKNRSAAEKAVTQFLQEPGARGVMILLDIDNFKEVNDTLGHLEGDHLLQDFAEVLRACFRKNDLKARIGGDEFVVFIRDELPEEILEQKLQRAIEIFHEEVFAHYSQCRLSVSIGAAYSNASTCTYKQLYKLADSAMYVAKFGGKNAYFIADENICMKKTCDHCRPHCKKRDYLIARGVLKESGSPFPLQKQQRA